MKISSPIWWFIGCTMLVLLACVGGSKNMSGYYLLPVGALGMVISLILWFVPRMSASKRTRSPASDEVEQRHPNLLTNLCLVHALLVTSAAYFAFNQPELFSSLLSIWLLLLGAWPFWIIVFLMNGWKTHQIMVTMIMGLVILSPLFLFFLVAWSLRHGGSLG